MATSKKETLIVEGGGSPIAHFRVDSMVLVFLMLRWLMIP